jgi:hypothetical protein
MRLTLARTFMTRSDRKREIRFVATAMPSRKGENGKLPRSWPDARAREKSILAGASG